MFEALCVKGSVPLHGAVLSGNTSDKKANTAELTRVARYLKKHGLDPAACIYVADSALVSADNLEALRGQPFITRLPANYKVAQAAVAYRTVTPTTNAARANSKNNSQPKKNPSPARPTRNAMPRLCCARTGMPATPYRPKCGPSRSTRAGVPNKAGRAKCALTATASICACARTAKPLPVRANGQDALSCSATCPRPVKPAGSTGPPSSVPTRRRTAWR